MSVQRSQSPWSRLFWIKRALYRDDRPGTLAKALNAFWARQYANGTSLSRTRDVQLEVVGRRSGRVIAFPVVLADLDGSWYAVSMLGEGANWVRNIRAAQGHAVIRHGGDQAVTLIEVPVQNRAPILKRYLAVAPGARPHMAADYHQSVAAFESAALNHPVFLVEGFAPRAERERPT